jgi:hypothetical protein
VHADFGPLGRIDLKIDITGSEPLPFPPLPGCGGKRPTLLTGKFHGGVRFEGEGELRGFVAHRGRVVVEREFKTVCKRPRHPKHPHPPRPKRQEKKRKKDGVEIDLLSAESRTEARKLDFLVLNFALSSKPPLSFAFVITASSERLGRVLISRGIIEIADHVLAFGKRGSVPETATVKVPKPFLGSALYSASPESAPTWSGDLRVPLPGAGVVPLTGPDFKAKLCRGFSEAALETCLESIASQAEPLLVAGPPSPLISFRNDFLSQILDMHPRAVKAFSGPTSPRGVSFEDQILH